MLPAIRTCATVPSDDLRLVTTAWRLLIDEDPGDGAWNMAVDRAVQIAHAQGEAPPTLRLYEWARPTVSARAVPGLRESSTRPSARPPESTLVRRYTGGRGVLHDDEVTYSVVAGIGDGIPRGTSASYGLLCGGLARAYRLLGVDAALTPRPRGSRDSAACYLHATQADLSLGLRKLSGSAQVWMGSTVLQHGSFTVSRDIAREASVFRLTAEERERLDEETVTLESALGCTPSRRLVRDCVAAGFSEALGLELVPGVLSDAESEIAAQLLGTLASHASHDLRPQAQGRAEPHAHTARRLRYNHRWTSAEESGHHMDENEARDDALLDLEHKSNDVLRGLLDELYAEEQRVSYRRRVLHGKIDILRAELVSRLKAGREGGDDVISGRDVDRLIEILANDLRGVSRFDVSAPDDDDSDEL